MTKDADLDNPSKEKEEDLSDEDPPGRLLVTMALNHLDPPGYLLFLMDNKPTKPHSTPLPANPAYRIYSEPIGVNKHSDV